jgi:hypothetical protein
MGKAKGHPVSTELSSESLQRAEVKPSIDPVSIANVRPAISLYS